MLPAASATAAVDDAALAAAFAAAFGIDPSPELAIAVDVPRAAAKGQRGGGGGGSGRRPSTTAPLTPEAFVAATLPLLAQEKEAEVEAARAALAGGAGRGLAPLAVASAEGGLLGRTLLTLVSAKGAGGPPPPLPPHRFTPHDLVELRPAKARGIGAGGGGRGEGGEVGEGGGVRGRPRAGS